MRSLNLATFHGESQGPVTNRKDEEIPEYSGGSDRLGEAHRREYNPQVNPRFGSQRLDWHRAPGVLKLKQ